MPVKFALFNGAVSPTLNGDNFFGWKQAILDAADDGGYLDMLLGKSPIPVDPIISASQVSPPTVMAASSNGGPVMPTSQGEEDAMELLKEISMDLRDRGFLKWTKLDFETKLLLSRSVDSAYQWQINSTDSASKPGHSSARFTRSLSCLSSQKSALKCRVSDGVPNCRRWKCDGN